MISGELKNKVDRLWETFGTGGITNPLEVIEQITYMMFIHDLDQADEARQKEGNMLDIPYPSLFEGKDHLKWSVLRDKPAELMHKTIRDEVFPFIKNLNNNTGSAYTEYMKDAIFKIPVPKLLDKIVMALDQIYVLIEKVREEHDVRGDLYEYMLSKLSATDTTPRHIIRMMVELLDLQPDDTLCDPACGTSGFLVVAGEYLKEKCFEEIFYNKEAKNHYHNCLFTGYDLDRTMLRIGAMNMMTHGLKNPRIVYKDSLSEQNSDTDKFSKILSNPPFEICLDYDAVSADLSKVAKTKKTEFLFLALFLRMLKNGGRCATIVPDSVLSDSSDTNKGIRKEIIENHRLEAIISMPKGVFESYPQVSTAVMILTKTGEGGTDKVWFYNMKSDGYCPDDKCINLDNSDIPDIVARFHSLKGEEGRKRTEQSFLVPKDEIAGNAYNLSINKYIQSANEEESSHPLETMTEIKELDKEISSGLADLGTMLRG